MDTAKRFLAGSICFVLCSQAAIGACAVERLPVRTATDTQASEVSQIPLPATIASLQAIPAPRPLPHATRIAPVETTVYSVTATLIAYRMTPQSEVQLVLSDDARRTIVATLPAADCIEGSRFRLAIDTARSEIARRLPANDEFVAVRQAIEVQGVGFFDFFQDQRGLAPNGLSLHPVIAVDFTPSFVPKAPPEAGRRRAVASGGSSCTRPSLTITATPGSVCAGQQATIAWQASDPVARVSIDGIGSSLLASGNRVLTAGATAIYSGRATTSCGTGDEALAMLTIASQATAAVSGPQSVTVGSSASITVSITNAASWTLASSLGNSITPSSGTASRTVTYGASRTGTDTLTLRTSGGFCADVTRTLSLEVRSSDPPPPPPPPPPTGLRCCDNTRSPTCFSCSNKRGCCSGHGGVCGC